MRRIASAQETNRINGHHRESRRTKGSVKVEFAKNENCSPVSPLQFGMVNLINNTDIRSCPGTASIGSDDDLATACQTELLFDFANLPNLLKARQQLRSSLDKVETVHASLIKSDSKLRSLSYRIFDSENASTSWQTKSSMLNHLIDEAFSLAVAFVKDFDSDHDVKRAVGAGTKVTDARRYLQLITQLEETVRSGNSESSLSLRRLQEAVQFLARSRLVDNLWMARLERAANLLKKMEKSFQEDSIDLELLGGAREHLERLLKRILNDYGITIPLPVSIPKNTEHPFRPPPPPPPLSTDLIQIVGEIIQRLVAMGRLNTCIDIYKELRCIKARDSLQTLSPVYLQFDTPEALDKLDWSDLETYIVMWTQHLEVLITVLLKVEHDLCQQVFSSLGPVWVHCFVNVSMQAGLESFLRFGEAFAKSEGEPHKLFKLLDMVNAVERVKAASEDFDSEACDEMIDRLVELKMLLLRAVFKVFREFRFQVEYPNYGNVPSDGGIVEFSSYAVTCVCDLISNSYQTILKQAFELEEVDKGGQGDGYELSRAVIDIMNSLDRHVEEAGKLLPDLGLSYLSLMNNYWYIYVTVNKNNSLVSLVGEEWLINLREKAKLYAHKYQREAWGSVLQHLSKEGLTVVNTKSSKVQVTLELQRIRAFQVAFEGVFQRHGNWHIPDGELRERIGKAVVKLVVPAYRVYLENFSLLVRQSQMPVQLKYSVDMIQHMLTGLFQDKDLKRNYNFLPDLLQRSRSTHGLNMLHDGLLSRSISTNSRFAIQLR